MNRKRIKQLPNRELLDLYIGTLPHEELLEYFNITDSQYQSILFDKPIRQIFKSGANKAYLEEDTPPPSSVELSEKYKVEITKFFIENIDKYNQRPEIIDGQSMTKEDYFMNQVLKMMNTNVIQSKKECGASVRNAIIDGYKKNSSKVKYLNNIQDDIVLNDFEKLADEEYYNYIINKLNLI
ncbi:hypothetical protein [Carboxylicivirga sp. RSCT41]|uniref:hypothetical protein n=1 Tax=Carboxylicivirga agarovorans TaxID=3417570 RepID=UPI003D3501A4